MDWINEDGGIYNYRLFRSEADLLAFAGFLVPSADIPATNDPREDRAWDLTALVWDDLGLTGKAALRFIEAALAGERERRLKVC